MTPRRWIVIGVVAVLVLAGLPAGYLVLRQRREAAAEAAREAAAATFATAWKNGTLATLSWASGDPAGNATAIGTATARLTSAKVDKPTDVRVVSVGKPADATPGAAPVQLEVTWTLTGDRPWQYPTTLTLNQVGDRWLPAYAPAVVHPQLKNGDQLVTATQAPKRGRILGAGDSVLVAERPVVVVGLEPSRTTDIDGSAQKIGKITGVDAGALAKRAKSAAPTAFVEAITLREAAYQAVRSTLQPIPGAVFQRRTLALAPTSEFARALIGTVGPATAEIVADSKGRVSAGDTTGLSGLQRSYDARLAGSPGLSVRIVPKAGSGEAAGGGTVEAGPALFEAAPVDGQVLHTTLDPAVQKAADAALKAASKPAGLVAIRVKTGEVLAVANGGPNANGYNRAFLGRYPPGSTFKVASALALLGAGVKADTPIPCPATLTVSGKEFSNAENEVLGTAPFHRDFADSCNTAFVGSASKIDAKQLAAAAAALGYGRPNQVGVTAFTGSVPTSDEPVQHAAAMIGQDKVLASPLAVAAASAAVAAGEWHAPRLVLDPTADPATDPSTDPSTDPATQSATAPAAAGTPLPAGTDLQLRKLMREVVTAGTGTGLRSVPGGPVAGKTGTAEFGQEKPPRTHAWFTGFQGDIAFAVVVEDGGFGAKSAVPLINDFLTRLN